MHNAIMNSHIALQNNQRSCSAKSRNFGIQDNW